MTTMTREGPGHYVAEIADVPVHVYRVDDGWALNVGGLDSGWTWCTKRGLSPRSLATSKRTSAKVIRKGGAVLMTERILIFAMGVVTGFLLMLFVTEDAEAFLGLVWPR